jgi:hypothetical protein
MNLSAIVKILIGLCLVFLLVSQIDIRNIGDILNSVQQEKLAYGLLFFLLATVFEVLKLHSLLYRDCKLISTFKIVFVGLFVNNFMPSNIGGDLYRVFMLKRLQFSLGSAVTPVLLDRLVGLGVLVFAGLVYAVSNISVLQRKVIDTGYVIHSVNMIWIAISFVVLSVIILLVKELTNKKQNKVIHKWNKFYSQVREALSRIRFREFISLLSFSMFFHLCRMFGVFFFVSSFNGSIELMSLFLVFAVVAMVSVLPISIGALGVREGTLTVMLVFFGVDLQVAIMVAITVLTIIWFKSLVGGILFITNSGE